MRKTVILSLLLLLPAAIVFAGGRQVAVRAYKAQTTVSFPNDEGVPVHGLVVTMNKKSVALADPQTGYVGPFRDLRGNGSEKLELSNPVEPIASGDGVVELTLRTEKKKLKIDKWWWTDHLGKRIGEKKEGE